LLDVKYAGAAALVQHRPRSGRSTAAVELISLARIARTPEK